MSKDLEKIATEVAEEMGAEEKPVVTEGTMTDMAYGVVEVGNFWRQVYVMGPDGWYPVVDDPDTVKRQMTRTKERA